MGRNWTCKRRTTNWTKNNGYPGHYRFIDETMTENDERTASEMKTLLSAKFGAENVTYSERTIERVRSELGWTFTTAWYYQAVHDGNKEKRVAWVNSCLEAEESFQDCIFIDEFTIQLECHRRRSFRKKNAPRKLKYKHKHPPKIHVWAGISKRGTTQFIMFRGIISNRVWQHSVCLPRPYEDVS